MRAISICISLLILLLTGSFHPSDIPDCREIVDNMLDSVRRIKTQQFNVKSTERVNGRLLFAESFVKLNMSPRKIYFKNRSKGIEVLWLEGENEGNALVHSRSLPLMNVNLDPLGSLMRKDQHHTIFDLGSVNIGIMLATVIQKAHRDFDKHFAYAGMIRSNNRDCYQILITYPEYKYIEYVSQKGETVTSIARKLGTSDYKIRFKNDLSSYFGEIRAGTKLTIPVPYANRAILHIDQKTGIPTNIKVYDEEGLFESYEFYNILINPVFAKDEFSKKYSEYNF